jgi:hypothetical protein
VGGARGAAGKEGGVEGSSRRKCRLATVVVLVTAGAVSRNRSASEIFEDASRDRNKGGERVKGGWATGVRSLLEWYTAQRRVPSILAVSRTHEIEIVLLFGPRQ